MCPYVIPFYSWMIIRCMATSHFILLLPNEHSGCFYFGAIENNATIMNIHVQALAWRWVFCSVGCIPRRETTGSYALLDILRNCQTLCGRTILQPHKQCAKVPVLPQPHQHSSKWFSTERLLFISFLRETNHFMSLFCSKPFIGFLHIQSKTFLKCWKDLAPTLALSFFSPVPYLKYQQLLLQLPSLRLPHRHRGVLTVCGTHQEEHSQTRTSASAVLGPECLPQTGGELCAWLHSGVSSQTIFVRYLLSP